MDAVAVRSLEGQWDDSQRRLAQWLSTPSASRTPATLGALASELGVTYQALSAWRKAPGFMAYVRYLMYQQAIDAFPDVWGTIIRKAVAGDIQYSKLFLSMIGESEIVAGSNAREVQHTMSDDEAIKIMERAGVRIERARIVE